MACRAAQVVRLMPVIAMLLSISACTGPQDFSSDVTLLATSTEGLDPSAAALIEEAKKHARTRVKSTAVGGVAGLLAGVIPSKRAADGPRGAVLGAAGGLGAIAGYAFGEYIDARETQMNMDQKKLSLLIDAAKRDAAMYEESRINAQKAIENSEQEVARLNQQYPTKSFPPGAYQSVANTLKGIAAALQALIREQKANVEIMKVDVLEANDVQKMGEPGLHPEILNAEVQKQQDQRDGMLYMYPNVVKAADAIPARERPVIELTPQ